MIPLAQARHFLDRAEPGAEITYARYSIASGGATVRAMRVAYNHGLIELAQRRDDDGILSYVAQKRRVIAKIEPGYRFQADGWNGTTKELN